MTYPSESQEQSNFVSWFRINYPNYIIFSVPNGGNRNLIEAKRLKDEGVTAGVYDLICLLPNGRTIFIEFKKQKGGVVSKNQKEFMSNLDRLGFEHYIAYGFADGIKKFLRIINI